MVRQTGLILQLVLCSKNKVQKIPFENFETLYFTSGNIYITISVELVYQHSSHQNFQ